MPLTETQDADGSLTFERRERPAKRAVGGTVLGGIAAWILYTFVDLLVFNLQHATREELRQTAPGYLFIFLGFLLFAVPACMKFFWRGRVVIASKEGTILRENDFWLFRRRRIFPLADVMAVYVSRGPGPAPAFPVQLALKSGKRITVAEEPVKDPSKKLARRLAALLGVEYESLM